MSSRVDTDASLPREEEQLLSRGFLTTVLGLSLIWNFTFLLGGLGGWVQVPPIHMANSLAFAVVTIASLVTLQWQWLRHLTVAVVYFVVLYVYLAAAQFLMPSDQFRILLFYPALGSVLFVLGYRAAFLALLVSYFVFGAAVVSGAMVASPIAVTSFVFTLGFTGLFFRIFHRQAIQALRLVAEKNALLNAAAHRDPLTGLLNLRALHDVMGAEMSDRGAHRPVAVLFVDVDHFKRVNDRFGHAGGDAVLKAVASVLKAAVRNEDSVARIGGEEFAIFLPGAGAETAGRIAERVRSDVEAMQVDLDGHAISVTLSIGVAVSQPPHVAPDALIRSADLAMYEAKDRGRNGVVAAWSTGI